MNKFNTYYAGAFSGVAEICISHPIDVVKIKLQSKITNFNSGIYKGFIPRLIGVVPMRLCYWGVQGTLNPIVNNYTDDWKTKGLLIGMGAGSVQTLIDCPIENKKINMITQNYDNYNSNNSNKNNFNKNYSNKNNFIKMKGFVPNLVRNNIFSIGFFSSHKYADSLNLSKNDNKRFALGFLGASMGCIISHPFDCVKTYKQNYNNINDKLSTIQVAKKIGYNKLWSGIYWRILTSNVSMIVGYNFYNIFMNILEK